MKKQLKSISVFQAAKVIALTNFVIVSLFCIPWGLYLLTTDPDKLNALAFFILPFFYIVLFFFTALIAVTIYNWIAGHFGGIEFELEDKP